MDFAFSVDHRVKMKENKMINKIQIFVLELRSSETWRWQEYQL